MPKMPDPIDAHVAQRLKLQRELAGFTQDRLGQAVGVSFQMIQKYEHAACRVGASRLMKIAKVLNVPVSWFFEGFGSNYIAAAGSQPILAQSKASIDDSLFSKKETLDLLKAYYSLPEPVRKHVLGMVQSMETQTVEVPMQPVGGAVASGALKV
jgi:transcriptional regulator with XRE-family HTH domain